MKLLLIKPPIPSEWLYGKMKDVGNFQQPLGIAYLAAYVRKKGIKVKIIDAEVLGLTIKEVIQKIKTLKPDVIGISSNTLDFNSSVTLAKSIKKNHNKPIILGGPHVSAIPEDSLKNDCFDVGVIGEGEQTLYLLLDGLKKGKFTNLDSIDGITFRKNRKVIVKPKKTIIQNLDGLPFPARDLLPDIKVYKPTPASCKKFPLGSIITSRGCPFNCTYCDRAVFGNKVRARSPENIVKEIEHMIEHQKIKEFKIWDDIFNINTDRLIKFCKLLIKKKIQLPWTCIGRLNFIDEKQVYWMKKAGCWQISVGIESGNDNILKKIKKSLTTKVIKEKIRIISKGGIKIRGFFMMGLPGENKDTVLDTIEFAKSLPLDTVSFCIFTPFPNTEIYAECNVKIPSWDLLRQNDVDNLVFVPEGLSKKEMKELYNKAYKSFYLRPKYILKKLLEIRNWYTLKSYMLGAKSMLKL